MPAKKKIAQTDAIFDRLKQVNPEADRSAEMLRLSLDAKTSVKIGCYSRKGKNRVLSQSGAGGDRLQRVCHGRAGLGASLHMAVGARIER